MSKLSCLLEFNSIYINLIIFSDDSAESFSDNFTPTPSKKSKLSRNDVFNNQSIDKNKQLNSAKPRCNIE